MVTCNVKDRAIKPNRVNILYAVHCCASFAIQSLKLMGHGQGKTLMAKVISSLRERCL